MLEQQQFPGSKYSPENKQLALAVRDRLRKNLRFLSFFMSPLLDEFIDEASWYNEKLGLDLNCAMEWRKELFEVGLWMTGSDGKTTLKSAWNGLGNDGSVALSTVEFLTVAGQILCGISSDGPCWYDTYTVVTSRAAKMEFISEVSLALKKLRNGSISAPGEVVFSWAHISIETFNATKKEDLV